MFDFLHKRVRTQQKTNQRTRSFTLLEVQKAILLCRILCLFHLAFAHSGCSVQCPCTHRSSTTMEMMGSRCLFCKSLLYFNICIMYDTLWNLMINVDSRWITTPTAAAAYAAATTTTIIIFIFIYLLYSTIAHFCESLYPLKLLQMNDVISAVLNFFSSKNWLTPPRKFAS